MTKLFVDNDMGGSWYVFGTKCILVREYDDDLLWLREYKSEGDEHFNVWMETQRDVQKRHMQMLLRTSF